MCYFERDNFLAPADVTKCMSELHGHVFTPAQLKTAGEVAGLGIKHYYNSLAAGMWNVL